MDISEKNAYLEQKRRANSLIRAENASLGVFEKTFESQEELIKSLNQDRKNPDFHFIGRSYDDDLKLYSYSYEDKTSNNN